MEHSIEFKSYTPTTGPNRGKKVHIADCSCNWGTPAGASQEELYRIILVHLQGMGTVKGLEV